MPKVNLLNQNGQTVGDIELNDAVFGAEYNPALIHEVMVAQAANARQGTKSALTRAEVRGGGIKPWRQKGTGRARQGSTRAPQWTGGGVIFAPKPRDFSKKVNKTAKRVAFLSALSQKLADNQILFLEDLKFENAKTKEAAKVLENLKLEKSVVVVTADVNENVLRACGNLANVVVTTAALLNVTDLVNNYACVILKDAARKIEEAYVI